MTLIKLTKVNYLGEGYVHFYRDIETGEERLIECTKEEYENLGVTPAPEIQGLEFTKVSAGGVVHVDTPRYMIAENEYCDFEDGYFAVFRQSNGVVFNGKIGKDKIIDDEVNNEIE